MSLRVSVGAVFLFGCAREARGFAAGLRGGANTSEPGVSGVLVCPLSCLTSYTRCVGVGHEHDDLDDAADSRHWCLALAPTGKFIRVTTQLDSAKMVESSFRK